MDTQDQLLRLLQLRDSGLLTTEEFEAKARLLMSRSQGSSSPSVTNTAPGGGGALGLIGAYELLEKVGEGGMGSVYRGRHRVAAMAARQGGEVAVKVVHPNLLAKADMVERLRREAEALAALEHPNIVKVFDVVEENGQTGIVMEWVPGRPLSMVIGEETGPIPWERAQFWVRPILDAVAHAHERGVVHRDLKPENIVVTSEGGIKLLDFGIARLGDARGRTKTGTGMGTVNYMAPEQFLDAKAVDERADIYALGLTIYEMVAGRLPWDPTQGEYEIMRRKEKGDIPPPTQFYPSIPPWVVDALMRALAPEPADRFPNVVSLSGELAGGGDAGALATLGATQERRMLAKELAGKAAQRAMDRLQSKDNGRGTPDVPSTPGGGPSSPPVQAPVVVAATQEAPLPDANATMTFTEAVEAVMTKYSVHAGRATRAEFWWFYLFYFFVHVGTQMVDAVLWDGIPVANLIGNMALVVPHLNVGIRRLHDTGRSGWNMLLPFTCIGVVPLLIYLIQESDKGDNAYGPQPVK
jgi:uncharacterized membrane protein YhaH (DUF805 family)